MEKKPRKPRASGKRIDWERVGIDYCANLLTVRELALKHKISVSHLMVNAKKNGWKRVLTEEIKALTDHKVNEIEIAHILEKSADKSASQIQHMNENIAETIATATAQIIARHKKSIIEDTERGQKLRIKFDNIVKGIASLQDIKEATVSYRSLVETTIKLIDIERKVYRIERDESEVMSIEDFLSKNIGVSV